MKDEGMKVKRRKFKDERDFDDEQTNEQTLVNVQSLYFFIKKGKRT